MALLGSILKRAIYLNKTVTKVRKKPSAAKQQTRTLIKLLAKSQYTAFGTFYGFSKILQHDNPVREFQQKIPVFDYNKLYSSWWHKTLEGNEDICWPGKITYFALSSGTSESSSKRIPITRDLLRQNTRTSVKQILTLSQYDLPVDFFEKGILMLGGSTDLVNHGHYFEGDLSGISQAKIPTWFHPFYKPGKDIARERDWNHKIDRVVEKAKDWDIGVIVGVPAWIQLTLERVISHYNLRHIHEIWPNLQVYTHGGVSFEPYKKGFEKLLGRPIHYLETYLASEGFIAYQSRRENKGMELVLDKGIFLEFIPFNSHNFDEDGNVIDQPETRWIDEVKEGEEYALLLSTCAGTWRYLIGDTVKFTDIANQEIVITGRTKHFLSLCGEHLSVDNMNMAVRMTCERLNAPIKEFTVAGVLDGARFAHKWFIGCDNFVDPKLLSEELDKALCAINDDYAVERLHALKKIYLEVLPSSWFYEWLELNGRIGSQTKFPRVLKGERLGLWEQFLRDKRNPAR